MSNRKTMPSVVYYGGSTPIVGYAAKKHIFSESEKTVSLAKTYLGTDKIWKINGQNYTPVDVSADILKALVDVYYNEFGNEDYKCIVTCPANYRQDKKGLISDAANKAGLNILGFLNEPTAAAISYFNDNLDVINKTIIVFDLGGGTLDVTVATCTEGSNGIPEYVVRTSKGIERLGGSNWDLVIQKELIKQCSEQSGCSEENIKQNRQDMNKIKFESEDFKKQLSDGDLEDSFTLSLTGELIDFELTQEDFENKTSDLLNEALNIFDIALKSSFEDNSSGLRPVTIDSIQNVILVGGASRMPQIKKGLIKKYPAFKDKILIRDPDYSISKGACIWCKKTANLEPDKVPLKERLSSSYGENMLVLKEHLIKNIDEYEYNQYYKLYDACSNIVYLGETIPCKKIETSCTADESQDSVYIAIYKNNFGKDSPYGKYIPLSKCSLCSGFYINLPAGLPKNTIIETTINIDAAGLMKVTSVCSGRQGTCEIKIHNECILTPGGEVDKILGIE